MGALWPKVEQTSETDSRLGSTTVRISGSLRRSPRCPWSGRALPLADVVLDDADLPAVIGTAAILVRRRLAGPCDEVTRPAGRAADQERLDRRVTADRVVFLKADGTRVEAQVERVDWNATPTRRAGTEILWSRWRRCTCSAYAWGAAGHARAREPARARHRAHARTHQRRGAARARSRRPSSAALALNDAGFFLPRAPRRPAVALEGALKPKEISYGRRVMRPER
jgi:hypothetical protein